MGLKVDISKELECLKKDETYIKHIIAWAEKNWKTSPEDVKTLMEEVLTFTKVHKYETAYIKVINSMAWYDLTFGNYVEVTKRALEAYEICKCLNEYKEMIRVCNILLVAYMKQGLFEEAIEYGLQGTEIAYKYGEFKLEGIVTLNILQLYIEVKEYDKALKMIKYLDNRGHTKNERYILFIESALAEIKLHTRNIEEAMIHCEKAYLHALEQGDSNALAELLYIRGQLQASNDKVVLAHEDFKKGSEISQKNNYYEFIIKGILVCSEEKIKQVVLDDEVEKELKKALKLAQEINAGYLQIEVYNVLEKYYNGIEDWKSAYHTIKAKEKCYKTEEKTPSDSLCLARLEQKSIMKKLQSYKKLYNQIQAISKVGRNFTANLEIDDIIELVYEQVNKLVSADIVGLGMCRKSGEFIYKAYGQEGEVIEVDKELYNRAVCLGTTTLHMKDDIMINNGDFKEYFTILDENNWTSAQGGRKRKYIQSAIFVKLKIDDQPIGIVGIGKYVTNSYTKDDLRSLQILSSYLAVALRNADLFNEIQYLAMYDALTGIYNRGTVLKLGQEQFIKNQQMGQPTTIIMLDIDYFKKLNDQYGHLVGDKVLSKISVILKENVRKVDFLGRYGGEEFIIILNNVSLESSMKIAKRINDSVAKYCFTDDCGVEVAMTISCGVYLSKGEDTFEMSIKKADIALYEAKALGRNRIVGYKENVR